MGCETPMTAVLVVLFFNRHYSFLSQFPFYSAANSFLF